MEEDKNIMLEIIVIALFLFAIILMIYSIMERNIGFCIMDIVIWLILAVFMLQGIEIPYQAYNLSANEIQTGVQTIRTNLEPLTYLFMGFALLMMVLTLSFSFEYLTDFKRIKK